MAQADTEAVELMGIIGGNDASEISLARRTGSTFRLLQGNGNGSAGSQDERRQADRLPPEQTRFSETAKLRGGFDVRIIDIGPRGVLIEAPTRLHIGSRAEVALFTADANIRLDLIGTVRRCHVSSLSPLMYRGGLEFDKAIEIQALQPFLAAAALSA